MATDADNPTLLQVLVLERVDRAKNMARFYVLSIEPTLFEDLALVRRWGRIGSAECERIDLHPSRPVAQIELKKWLIYQSQEAPRIPAQGLIVGRREIRMSIGIPNHCLSQPWLTAGAVSLRATSLRRRGHLPWGRLVTILRTQLLLVGLADA